MPLDDIEDSNGGQQFTIGEKVKWTVDELAWQCKEAGIHPDKIVLAGGGCRLPLVGKLMAKVFGREDRPNLVLYDPEYSKRRVAYGMAKYLANLHAEGLVIRPARSVDVIHHHLGLKKTHWEGNGIVEKFEPIVRAGSPLEDQGTWYGFHFSASGGPRQLALFLQSYRHGLRLFGKVDFRSTSAPLPGDGPINPGPWPDSAQGPYDAALRQVNATRIEVRVRMGDTWYGPYPVRPESDDPESLLQG